MLGGRVAEVDSETPFVRILRHRECVMRKSFNELAAFQRAMDLVVIVYDVTSRFPSSEKFGLSSQLQRAAIGIISHIAEGQGRLTYGEWRQFLSHARGSLYEVEAQLLAARRLRFLAEHDFVSARTSIRRVAAPLTGLIRWVQARERGNPATRQPVTATQKRRPGNRQAGPP